MIAPVLTSSAPTPALRLRDKEGRESEGSEECLKRESVKVRVALGLLEDQIAGVRAESLRRFKLRIEAPRAKLQAWRERNPNAPSEAVMQAETEYREAFNRIWWQNQRWEAVHVGEFSSAKTRLLIAYQELRWEIALESDPAAPVPPLYQV